MLRYSAQFRVVLWPDRDLRPASADSSGSSMDYCPIPKGYPQYGHPFSALSAGPAAAGVELIINMKTVKTLGLAVTQSIWLRADEVIE